MALRLGLEIYNSFIPKALLVNPSSKIVWILKTPPPNLKVFFKICKYLLKPRD